MHAVPAHCKQLGYLTTEPTYQCQQGAVQVSDNILKSELESICFLVMPNDVLI